MSHQSPRSIREPHCRFVANENANIPERSTERCHAHCISSLPCLCRGVLQDKACHTPSHVACIEERHPSSKDLLRIYEVISLRRIAGYPCDRPIRCERRSMRIKLYVTTSARVTFDVLRSQINMPSLGCAALAAADVMPIPRRALDNCSQKLGYHVHNALSLCVLTLVSHGIGEGDVPFKGNPKSAQSNAETLEGEVRSVSSQESSTPSRKSSL